MKPWIRLAAVGVALLVPALVLARWGLATASFAETEARLTLAEQLGPWKLAATEELEDEILAQIAPDAYLMRMYEAPGRAPVWVYVGLYAEGARAAKSAHDPEVCYPAQGWEIMASRALSLGVAGDEVMQVKQLQAQNGALEEQVLYWFQPADRWQLSYAPEQLTRVLDAVRGRPQYAFVRLSATGTHEVIEDLVELAPAIAVAIREDVDRL